MAVSKHCRLCCRHRNLPSSPGGQGHVNPLISRRCPRPCLSWQRPGHTSRQYQPFLSRCRNNSVKSSQALRDVVSARLVVLYAEYLNQFWNVCCSAQDYVQLREPTRKTLAARRALELALESQSGTCTSRVDSPPTNGTASAAGDQHLILRTAPVRLSLCFFRRRVLKRLTHSLRSVGSERGRSFSPYG